MYDSAPVAPVWNVRCGSCTFVQVLPPSNVVYAQPEASLRCSRLLKTR